MKWLAPMLATLIDQPFSEPGWILERKLDGMRCVLYKIGNKVSIWSRNKKLQNNVFPELVLALEKIPSDFVLDCEVVISGRQATFTKLQNRMHVQNPGNKLIKKYPVIAYVFDIMYLNGYDLCNLPLIMRKKALKENFKFNLPLKYLISYKKNGIDMFKESCSKGWEGIIAKRADSVYEHRRSRAWLKVKCGAGQELVIGGYTQPQGQRVNFGALLLGYYDNGKLKYAGKVGTGFDVAELILLHKKMTKLHAKQSPFDDYESKSKNIVWLKPKLIAELGFSEWTDTGRLRHPRYLGLRTDKKPTDIRRENK